MRSALPLKSQPNTGIAHHSSLLFPRENRGDSMPSRRKNILAGKAKLAEEVSTAQFGPHQDKPAAPQLAPLRRRCHRAQGRSLLPNWREKTTLGGLHFAQTR